MEITDEQQQAYQVHLRHLLDTHLAPLLKEEWKSTLSFYEAGIRPSSGSEELSQVVAWMRSKDILEHTEGLLNHFTIDPVERVEGVGTGDPQYKDGTLIVRLYRKINGTDLVLHLFQIFGEGESCEAVLDGLRNICKCSSDH